MLSGDRERTAAARTAVKFAGSRTSGIDWYLASGEWRGRAGGYAIQGRGAALVAAIEGDYTTSSVCRSDCCWSSSRGC